MKKENAKYIVRNVYDIRGESYHRSLRAAIKERDSREGDGWACEDQDGQRMDSTDI
jgi:hypothetical protein